MCVCVCVYICVCVCVYIYIYIYGYIYTRKQWQKKWKAQYNFEKSSLNSSSNCSRERKRGSWMYRKRTWKQTLGKNIPTLSPTLCWGVLIDPIAHISWKKIFDDSPLKLGEIIDFIGKAQAKSSPGINGISYNLYKRCHCEENDEIRDKQWVCQYINSKGRNSRLLRLYWTYHYVVGLNKNGEK